jgi:hypothetical protein
MSLKLQFNFSEHLLQVSVASITVVIIIQASPAVVRSATRTQGLFDLTNAEARIARRISSGETVNEISTASNRAKGRSGTN